jgi:hypothetical protein
MRVSDIARAEPSDRSVAMPVGRPDPVWLTAMTTCTWQTYLDPVPSPCRGSEVSTSHCALLSTLTVEGLSRAGGT